VTPPRPTRFMVLVYRMPPQPTANRVYVWRMLKKVGAVYLQQSVTVFPDTKAVVRELQPILEKISASSGEFHLLPLRQLPQAEMDKLVAQFVDQTSRHYQEIIENCEVDFAKEIEFETFRRNFTYEEAEEIRAEYEKIVSWFERVGARDWFGAPNRPAALEWLERSREMLEAFEAKVYEAREQAEQDHGASVPGRRAAPGRARGRRRSA
jgi:hypothetical protein